MPNHITNNLEIIGDTSELEKLVETVKYPHKQINFSIEKYYPMPENDELASERASERSAMPYWYNWRIQNWGTKWDVYEVSNWEKIILTGEVPTNTKMYKISFLTAWSTPFKAIVKLSQLFPTLDFVVEYADEDIGSNCGSYILKNGEVINQLAFDEISNVSVDYANRVMKNSAIFE